MLFENNYTLNKWPMTNTPPRIKKFGVDQKMTPYKNDTTKSDTFAKRHNSQKRCLKVICHGRSNF